MSQFLLKTYSSKKRSYAHTLLIIFVNAIVIINRVNGHNDSLKITHCNKSNTRVKKIGVTFKFVKIFYYNEDFSTEVEIRFPARSHGKWSSEGLGGNLKRLARWVSLQLAVNMIIIPIRSNSHSLLFQRQQPSAKVFFCATPV